MPTTTSYDSVAKFLHWVIAAMILGLIVLGWVMNDLPRTDPLKFSLFQWHKSIGITVLLLSLFRLYWRMAHPVPPPPAGPAWENKASKAVVVLFYILMVGVPLLGWAVVSASPLNIPTTLYGYIPWPHLPILPTLENKKEIGKLLGDAHGFLANSFLALLALHVGAALKHHFVARNDVLTRMSPKFMTGFLNRLRG